MKTKKTNKFQLSELFAIFEDRIPQQLISKSAITKTKIFAEKIPGQSTAFFGFECLLDKKIFSADLLFCCTQLEGHTKILAGQHPSIKFAEELFELPAWKIVLKFCQHWQQPNSVLFNNLLNIWLEFDIGENSPPYQPSIFFGTKDPKEYSSKAEEQKIIIKALTLLAPEACSGLRLKTLEHVFTSLPDKVHIFQIGAMLSRKSPAIRLCLRNLKIDEITSTLKKIGWSGSIVQLENLISNISSHCDRIDVDIDVGDTIGNKIGLECSFGKDQHTFERIDQFGKYLVKQQLTTQTKVDALKQFHGLIHQDSAERNWPKFLLKIAALLGQDIANHLVYWLHHIKIVFEEDKATMAKAYLALAYDRTPRTALRSQLRASANNPNKIL